MPTIAQCCRGALPHCARSPTLPCCLQCCREEGDPQVPAPADAGTLVCHLPPPRLVRLASVALFSSSTVDWAVFYTLALP